MRNCSADEALFGSHTNDGGARKPFALLVSWVRRIDDLSVPTFDAPGVRGGGTVGSHVIREKGEPNGCSRAPAVAGRTTTSSRRQAGRTGGRPARMAECAEW